MTSQGTATGIVALDADAYHRDDIAGRPSLSRTIASILCDDTKTPAHAWLKHPRLNPDYQPDHDEKFDIGTAAHALLLGGITRVQIVYHDDWRTTAAKEARDHARVAGSIPLLERHWQAVEDMVDAVRLQLDQHEADPPLFTDGKPEQTIVWEEPGGVICRARPDWLRDDLTAIDDFKTAHDASPSGWTRRALYDNGYDIQAAFYLRGLRHTQFQRLAEDAEFRFVVVEKTPPYALSVISLGPHALMLAEKKVAYAIDIWRKCLNANDWPGYPRRVAYAELPAWEETRWLEKEVRDA